MTPYRVAIIGTGNSVDNHVEAIRHVGDRAELVAAVDVDGDRAKAFAEQNHVPHWYTTSSDMIAAEQPDLVCIVTPPATHFPLIVGCLEGGAWVYCEKPLCKSLAEFDEITRAEQRTGRYVSSVAQWRFGSAVTHLRALMATGEMGRPLIGLCNTLWYRDMAYYQSPWRGKWATEVGGPTATLGIHLMDLFLWLLGDWEEITAVMGTLDHTIEVEDVSMALVRFTNGTMGSIINSTVSPRQESMMRLDFQRATVEVNALYRYTNQNWRYSIHDKSPDAEALQRWTNVEKDVSGTHGVQLNALLDSMDRGERPLVSGQEARRVLDFIASLYKSAITGQSVRRGSIKSPDPFYFAMNSDPFED